jgi:hypothetical protein
MVSCLDHAKEVLVPNLLETDIDFVDGAALELNRNEQRARIIFNVAEQKHSSA